MHNKTITYKKYIDENGNPTCAINFTKGEVCHFFCTKCFGVKETCFYADGQLLVSIPYSSGELIRR